MLHTHPASPAAAPLRRRVFTQSLLATLAPALTSTISPARATGEAQAQAPLLSRPSVYRPGLPLADYWVSEKYDGVRGYWDGRQLLTRSGETVPAPAWFTAGWPAQALDGELWAGHGAFSRAVSTVRQRDAGDAAWHGLRFMVFDLPGHGGLFDERLPALQAMVAGLAQPWVQAVAQRRLASHAALMALLRQTVKAGGEGLVLHRGASRYHGQRGDDLAKLKPYEDADAKVVSHVAGQGKYAGLMGALWVETPEGRRFKLGTGFTDEARRDPPPVGAWVTYRFRDTTAGGLPRFASFMRVREDLPITTSASR